MKTETKSQWDAIGAAELIMREIAECSGCLGSLRDKAEAWLELNAKRKASPLIAAAPELLDAVYKLEHIIVSNMTHTEECYHVTNGGSCNCGATAAVQLAKNVAHTAIAKATGGANV